ncbi:NAD-P-binding protein [Pyrenochaeta sp. MPI-SDFR-AT-0127]|nr:NAD-P-binding protein [Pyrenochaeta sp. MPI-SDFR-AT-0127]
MAPIRVGIIGLSSATGELSAMPGGCWASLAHLPYLQASPHYEVVALCNSSVKSAEAAVKRYDLPSTTKTYGSPEDIAKDPDVDLVVVCVRVDRHHRATLPALKAGKDVYVEWPLASNLQQAEELLAAAKQSGSKTIVGLQGRPSPIIQKVKELVNGKAIGELLSSNMIFDSGFPGDVEPAGVDFLTKKEIGGNNFTILFSHGADPVFHALGGLEEATGLLATRWPETKLLHSDGSFDKLVKRETPDHVMMQGTVSNNSAPISIAFRNGKPFKDTPPLTWRIFGTKGEIRVTANANIGLALGGEKIELYDHEKDTVEAIDVLYADKLKHLPAFAKNIGKLYELFIAGGPLEQGFVDFEQAVGMHKIIDTLEKSNEGRKYQTVA